MDVKELREVQAEVRKELPKAFTHPLNKEWNGSDPVSAFDRAGTFKENNWNDRRVSLFRRFFRGFFSAGAISNEIAFIGNLSIVHHWDEDQNYVFIQDNKTNDTYYATWYKSRGRTDLMLRNGRKITLTFFGRLLLEMLKPPREAV